MPDDIQQNEIESKKPENKVLVVDDDPFLIRLISKYFPSDDYDVTGCKNGKDALAAIKDGSYDLIILDIMLPDMLGYDICRKIREQYSLFELPILMLTSKDKIDDMVAGFDAGANDYLSKPFNKNELLARTKTLVRLHRLTKANTVLQEAIEIKNQFLNMTIHDLKNPLGIILNLTELLRMDLDVSDEQDEYFDLIKQSSQLMLNLVNELLEAVKIESGKMSLNKTYIDVTELIVGQVTNNLPNAQKKRQRIHFEPDFDNQYYIFADYNRITEVFSNLLSNAIKYSPFDKNIYINVEMTEGPKHKQYVQFSIADEGPGMTDDDKSKVFGTFQRLSAQPTGGESSSGLGLSIVKQLVELHDGNIWVESEYGKGSEFFVKLPATDINIEDV